MAEFSRRVTVQVIKDEPMSWGDFFMRWRKIYDDAKITADYKEYLERHQAYRWRAVAGNNEVVAHGESYFNLDDAVNAIELLFGDDTTIHWAPTFDHDARGLRLLRYGATDRATHTNNGYTPSGMDEFAPHDQAADGEGADE